MCYYPYFRGRQNELIVIRENAEILAKAQFIPIIEPVKPTTSGLSRALVEMKRHNGKAIIIVNPGLGKLQGDASTLKDFIRAIPGAEHISIGIRVGSGDNLKQVAALCRQWMAYEISIIHYGFADGNQLSATLAESSSIARHVFVDNHCSKLYRKHFKNSNRVLVRDGFKKQRTNRDYPELEAFSDLHVTYDDEGLSGFGDFLIVGDDYQESGGAAYSVAIHLTFIDSNKDDEMYARHFVSVSGADTPEDPAGKFAEALQKLVNEVEQPNSQILKTNAVLEFLDLHNRGHFPGLGYVKKLSMQHHIETLADYFRSS